MQIELEQSGASASDSSQCSELTGYITPVRTVNSRDDTVSDWLW